MRFGASGPALPSVAAMEAGGVSQRNVAEGFMAFTGVLHPDGTVVDARLFTPPSEQKIEGRKLWDSGWWDHSSEEQACLQRGIERARGGEAARCDTEVCLPGEEPMWLDLHIVPQRDAGGDVSHLLLGGTDITDRKREEIRLKRRMMELEAFVEEATIGLHWVDAQGIIQWANQAELDLLGYSKEEYLGRSITEFHADREVIDDILARLTRGERLEEYEARLICKNGAVRYVSINSSVFRENGRFGHTQCFTTDITERKRAERARNAIERRLRETIDALPAAVYTTDKAGRLTHFNPAAAEISGRVPELHTDRWCVNLKLYYPDGSPMPLDQCPMAVALKTGVASAGSEAIAERPDGTRVWFAAFPTPLRNADGEVDGGVNMLVDITEQRRVQAKLREEAKRKDEFLAMLAHELRNPLAAIRHAIELLYETAGNEPERGHHWSCEVIDRQSAQLSRMVDDLLDVARSSRGRVELRVENLDLAEVLHGAAEVNRPLMESRSQQLRCRMPTGTLLVKGDPARLEQVFGNLLNNASKYTADGREIFLSAERDGDQVVVSVRDKGIGIPPALLPDLFDLFRQAETSLDRSQGGLGIGLTIVKSLVELHGGTVDVKSEGLGKGSEFTVRLPFDGSPVTPCRERVRAPEWLEKQTQRVLVVDDHRDAALGLARLLRRRGYDVEVAHDGGEALKVAETSRPEIFILDLGLPSVDGYEVARALRANPQFKGALLIAVSGYAQEEDRARSQAAGFDRHFAKPLPFDTLLEVIADHGQ